MADMKYESRHTVARFETSKGDLIARQGGQTYQRHPQSLVMKQRDPKQGQTEQYKFD